MTLYDKIMKIYPQLTPQDFSPGTGTISLRNDSDSKEDYIEKWENETYPKPTDEQLAAITSQ
jgi:XkdW protein